MSLIDNVDDTVTPVATPADAEAPKLDDVIAPIPDAAPAAADTANPDTAVIAEVVPEKYKGKSIQEVISMHQNAESLVGKQSGEVGELRNIVDDFIKNQNTSQSTQDTTETEEIDFLDDPAAAVKKAIDEHPDVVAARGTKQSLEQQAATKAITDKHPDIGEMFKDQNFIDWVGSSQYRTNALRKANDSYDIDAADEVFGTWKELQASKAPPEGTDDADAAVKAEASKNLADAQTGVVNQGAGESKKIYRRSDIRNLMITDREKYESLQPELQLAYREGRVR